MAEIGKLELDCITSDRNTHCERLESNFEANRVAAAAKIDTCISVAGGKTYKFLKCLLAPEKLKDKILDKETCGSTCSPKSQSSAGGISFTVGNRELAS